MCWRGCCLQKSVLDFLWISIWNPLGYQIFSALAKMDAFVESYLGTLIVNCRIYIQYSAICAILVLEHTKSTAPKMDLRTQVHRNIPKSNTFLSIDESCLLMKFVYRWKLSIDESRLLMKVVNWLTCLLMKVVYWWKLSIGESRLLMKFIYWWMSSIDESCLLMKVV